MSPFVTSVALVMLALALLGVGAFVLAWGAARYADRRMAERAREGRAQRPWGGRDYGRVRSKYFAKEERARAARAHYRAWHAPSPEEPPGETPAPGSPEARHRETLGLEGAEITLDDLRAAFRRRIREYHPDRVAGLGPKLRRLAEEETKRINEAYRFFKARLRE